MKYLLAILVIVGLVIFGWPLLREDTKDECAAVENWTLRTAMSNSRLAELSPMEAALFIRQWAKAAEQRSKPQPAQTIPQPGSTEWFAFLRAREQNSLSAPRMEPNAIKSSSAELPGRPHST